jgi:hypothetical protein
METKDAATAIKAELPMMDKYSKGFKSIIIN